MIEKSPDTNLKTETLKGVEQRIAEKLQGLTGKAREKAFEKALEEEYGKKLDKWTKKRIEMVASISSLVGVGLAVLFFVYGNEGDLDNTKLPQDGGKNPKNEIQYEAPEFNKPKKDSVYIPAKGSVLDEIEKKKIEPTPPNPRFDQKVFESLPDYGKDIYKFFAEQNPTPGKSYAFLDKTTAKTYIFDKDNKLIKAITTGFGQTPGDAHNNAFESGFNAGNMTTPAGIYFFWDFVNNANQAEYGELGFSLLGVSVLGNEEFLGLHQVYKKELKERMEKLASLGTKDNAFSNGCINITDVDFEKNISSNFNGDYSEFLFVLPDANSTAPFDIKRLVKQIIPKMIVLINASEQEYLEYLNTNTAMRKSMRDELIELRKGPQKGWSREKIAKFNREKDEKIKRLEKQLESDQSIYDGQFEYVNKIQEERRRLVELSKSL